MIRRRTRDVWWISLFPIVPLVGLIVCICLSAPVWLLGLCVIALISGIIQFLADCNQLYTWRQRLAEAEAEGRDDGNG